MAIPVIGPIFSGIGSIIGIIGLILQVIRMFPDLIKTIQAISEMIKLLKGKQEVSDQDLKAQLIAALKEAKEKGDKAPVLDLAKKLAEKVKSCEGVGCPSELKRD